MPGFMTELHGRLEEVDVKAGNSINHLHAIVGSFGGIPVIPYQAAYHIAILLLDMTTIVFLIGTRASKSDFLLSTIGIEAAVDKFATII
jgi:hypothetical protein